MEIKLLQPFITVSVQKTETNEKNSAKNVENAPLQLADNERVANVSLEEKRSAKSLLFF